ncbi:LysR substrate-binding domain-containing protein [Pseudoduganella sp. RAF19]|uniref:LysR substrate-binding domain-containing protein n=2 Tax=unclassified Pseudoduganella TaxID=2637179 RepID=UPI003F9AD895
MHRRLPSLSALRAFEAAARHLSFKLAAEELSVTATSISHQMKALEEALDCRLFVRKTRAVELTEQGRILLQATGAGFDAIAAGVESLRNAGRRTVTLSTTPAFAARWLVPRLAAFQQAHPGIDLHVQATTQVADLRSGGADLAVRGGRGHYAGLQATLLMRGDYAPVASPRLKLRRPRDLLKHPLIHFEWQRGGSGAQTWARWAQAAGLELEASAGIVFSEESHAVQAAIAGQGVALASLPLVSEEIAMGLLEAPFAPLLQGFDYYLVRLEDRELSAAAATVESWLTGQATQED